MMWGKIKRVLFAGGNGADARFAGKSVLTIEDDPTQSTMIRRTLEKRGFKVFVAGDGPKGLELAQAQRPDIILLDVILPGMRGYDVCRRLKSDGRTKDIPVLFLTSLDDPKDVIAQYDLGGDVHLSKPINARELLAQIEISLKEQARV